MDVDVYDLDGIEGFGQIDQTLRRLVESVSGTIPGSRSFGLMGSSVNLTPEEARNVFARELDEKVDEFLPEIVIENVELTGTDEGAMKLSIYVGAKEGTG